MVEVQSSVWKLKSDVTDRSSLGPNVIRNTRRQTKSALCAILGPRSGRKKNHDYSSGVAIAASAIKVFPGKIKPTDPAAKLPVAETKTYHYEDNGSFTLTPNIGATLLDLNLGKGSLLWSPITDEGGRKYTGKLGGAGSVGSASVWAGAGRIFDSEKKYRMQTATRLIDLEQERLNGGIPSSDGLGMHGLGFTSDKWKVKPAREKDGFMIVEKSLNFDSDTSLAKLGDKGQLKYTHSLGINETGNKVFRTKIEAATSDPNEIAHLSSLAEHYFFRGDKKTIVSSNAIAMHDSMENTGNSALPAPGFSEISYGSKYDLIDGVKILGDDERREAILCGFTAKPDSRGMTEVARINRGDFTLVIRQKASLGGENFPNGILVYCDPKSMPDRFCIEPYFGYINGQNREFNGESHIQALTVGKGHGKFEAEIEIEQIPNN